jgi:hypothetical protein
MKPMVQHVWSEKHSPDHARVGHGESSTHDPDPWLRGEPGAEEKYLFQYLRRVRKDLGNRVDNVRYIEDEERWRYQIVFRDGKAHERIVRMKRDIIKGVLKPLTTNGADLGTWVYAIDESGVFYTEVVAQDGYAAQSLQLSCGPARQVRGHDRHHQWRRRLHRQRERPLSSEPQESAVRFAGAQGSDRRSGHGERHRSRPLYGGKRSSKHSLPC